MTDNLGQTITEQRVKIFALYEKLDEQLQEISELKAVIAMCKKDRDATIVEFLQNALSKFDE